MKIILALIICCGLGAATFFNINIGNVIPSEKLIKTMPPIKLVPMNELSFKELKEQFILRSADNHVKNDLDSWDDTHKRAVSELRRVLHSGMETSNHSFYDIIADDIKKKVGTLWLWKYYEGHTPILFLYDICIFDEFQNKGYGTSVLKAYEEKARSIGAKKLRLHVFNHNEGARRLYSRMGFFITGHNMAENLN